MDNTNGSKNKAEYRASDGRIIPRCFVRPDITLVISVRIKKVYAWENVMRFLAYPYHV